VKNPGGATALVEGSLLVRRNTAKDILMCCFRSALFGGFVGVGIVLPAVSQSPGPTLEKCSCYLDEGDQRASSGARAANATLCIQNLDRQRRWCEITVHCLRDGRSCPTPPGNAREVVGLYELHLKELSKSPSPEAERVLSRAQDDLKIIGALTREGEIGLVQCLTSFQDRNAQELIQKGAFSCRVDRDHWLILTYDLEAQRSGASSSERVRVRLQIGPRE
jgi:hypothetical protein